MLQSSVSSLGESLQIQQVVHAGKRQVLKQDWASQARGRIVVADRREKAKILNSRRAVYPITSCRGAMNGLLAVVLEDHIKEHFSYTPANTAAGRQLLDVVRSYFK